MALPDGIQRLDRIAAFLTDAGHPLAGWLAEVVGLARLGVPVGDAMALGHGYEAVCRRLARDDALAALGAAFPGSKLAQGTAIANAIARHQTRGGLPADIKPHVEAYLAAGGPESARAIRLQLSELAKIPRDPANSAGAC